MSEAADVLCAAQPCERRADVLVKATMKPLRTSQPLRNSFWFLTCFLQRGHWRRWRKGLTCGTRTDMSGRITGIRLLYELLCINSPIALQRIQLVKTILKMLPEVLRSKSVNN